MYLLYGCKLLSNLNYFIPLKQMVRVFKFSLSSDHIFWFFLRLPHQLVAALVPCNPPPYLSPPVKRPLFFAHLRYAVSMCSRFY